MHLFLVDLFISIDVLAPIIYFLKKKNIIVCNINPIQDHSKSKSIKYLKKKKIEYFNYLPLDEKKIFSYFLLKVILILPCYFQKKLRRLLRFIYINKNFSSKEKVRKFLIQNSVKSITYEESAPDIYISIFYQAAKDLNIEVIKITSGLGVYNDKSAINSSKVKFCDKIFLPNQIYKINKKFKKKVKIIGSLRYTRPWFKILNRIDGKLKWKKNRVTLGFFKKSYSKENSEVEKLIKKLNDSKKFNISTRDKPRDIFTVNCNKFEKDELSSSQLIDKSDFIVTSRPSSILIEALLKNKKIVLLYFINNDLYKTPFNTSKAFFKIEKINELDKIFFKKKIAINKTEQKKFLQKALLNWNKPNKVIKNFNAYYDSLA